MQLLRDVSKETTQETNVTTQQPQNKMDKFYPPKPKINAFNELFTCYLCQGYMINPTTIDVCMHTYCRSCIARHLAVDCYCPQCKNSGGKTITISNLTSDDILRSVIFKLVPGLYQKERERLVQFVNNTKNEENLIGSTHQSLSELLEVEDDLFSPADPISLSLEYHPALAGQCPDGAVPPVRYLQCPASVKIQHLKRFLCSKFNIDPCNKRVGIDVMYDEEVLPSDFTLMDVGYSYKWERHAPLKFTYRILIYDEDISAKSNSGYVMDDKVSGQTNKSGVDNSVPTVGTNRTVTFAKEKIQINGDVQLVKAKTPLCPSTTTPSYTTKVKSVKSLSSKCSPPSSDLEVPVKVTISRKSADSKKTVSKKSSATDEFVVPTTTTNDFKSLRSNDIRYSDYAITSSTTTSTASVTINHNTSNTKKENTLNLAKEEKSAKCDVVVSIPHNQMPEQWETKSLSQMKTASKKSPNPCAMENMATVPAKKIRNVPKLKIELNSLRTKLIEKPKSADIRLDTLMVKKHHRHRKFSLDEPQPLVDKVDLETYVKNIGLKPIEIQTKNTPETEVSNKITPNASPMSSSSSNTSSSTGKFNFNYSADITSSTSSSSHKKRKKKHSKDSREPKDSKRKKMHAEISSHSAEESLKMKVKLTTPINMKALRLESKKSPPVSVGKCADPLAIEKQKSPANKLVITLEKPKSPKSKGHDKTKDKSKSRSSESKKSRSYPDSKKLRDLEKSKPLEINVALTQPALKNLASTKSSDNQSISKEFDDDEDLIIPDTTATLGIGKSLSSIKDNNLPHSPPLPPSLFKTTPLSFSTFSPNVTTVTKPKAVAMPKESKDKPKTSQMKPIAPKPIATKPQQSSSLTKSSQFAVPNPPRFLANNSTKFLATPTSIASAANKHMGNLLKRSMSLDENKSSASTSKHARIEKPNQITVSAYGSNLHMTKVEIPATPTSSTAKATYEIPLYSPLSASYNPKCSFSVNTAMSAAKNAKVSLQISMASHATPVSATAKQTFATNTAASNKPDAEVVKKPTANDIKPTTTTISSIANNNNNSNCKSATLMGPPMPMQKLNSGLTVIPTEVKSPPLSTVLPQTTTHNPVLNTSFLSSPLSMVNYRQSKVLIAHGKPTNLPELKTETTTATTTTAATTTTTNGLATTEKPKSSLRQFRLPSRDSAQDILDLSAASAKASSSNGVAAEKKPLTPTANPTVASATTSGSTLEMALNKIKQNMSTTSANVDNTRTIQKQELAPISDDLQNLHMLSESATAREKIAISSATANSSLSASLYEKPKISQNSLVRQQNASVRNIPNPSALAFRNQQPNTILPPMVTIAASVLAAIPNNGADKSLILKQPSSPPKSPQSTSSTSPLRNCTKKHPSIDQVAASLNIRASAAAEASAKANSRHSDESTLVTSTSSALAEKVESKEIKQETAELTHSVTSATQPSSTVTIRALEVVEIKKEPEERMPEIQVEHTTEVKTAFPKFVSKKPSMVEHLVTSVKNVTTPTSTLLAASSAGY